MTQVLTTVKCPICKQEYDVNIDALTGSGEVPLNKEFCNVCGTEFTVSATVDIEVKEVNG